jgi:hypothetical protein
MAGFKKNPFHGWDNDCFAPFEESGELKISIR